MKKTLPLALLLTLFLILSFICKAGVSVQPPELWITMDNKFIQGNTYKKITLTNNNDNSINFTWYIEHPAENSIRADRTFIPSLSWVDLEPKWHVTQPGDTASFYIYLNIPEIEENLNQHWEIWATFKLGSGGGMFNQEHAVRVYIDTPVEAEVDQGHDSPYLVIGDQIQFSTSDIAIMVIVITLLVLAVLIYKKKKP